MGERPPQQLLYTPTIPLGVEGKPSPKHKKKRGREEEKAMSYARDKGKTNYIQDTRDLISMRKKTLVKNPQSLRGNPTLAKENRLPQSNEKFEPQARTLEESIKFEWPRKDLRS